MFTIPLWCIFIALQTLAVLKAASPQHAAPVGSYLKLYAAREAGPAEPLAARSRRADAVARRRGPERVRGMAAAAAAAEAEAEAEAEERAPDDLEALFEGPADVDKQIYPEYTESLPGSWEREARELGVQKHFPICHLERKIVSLNTGEYEYRPAYYEEIKCAQKYYENTRNEICSSLGFSCFQWNKTIHLTRRRYSSECWETRTLVIPAGCECMWPTHRLGDIKFHL